MTLNVLPALLANVSFRRLQGAKRLSKCGGNGEISPLLSAS
jgi:hypothetical protein